MSADSMRVSLEAKRNENLSQLEFEKNKQAKAIETQARSERSRVSTETNVQITTLEAQQGELQSHIGSLQSTLDNMPQGHPERGKVEKALSAYTKRLLELREMTQKLKARMASHLRMISFQEMMQKKNVEINVGRQRELIKARFTELIGNMLASSGTQTGAEQDSRKEVAAASA